MAVADLDCPQKPMPLLGAVTVFQFPLPLPGCLLFSQPSSFFLSPLLSGLFDSVFYSFCAAVVSDAPHSSFLLCACLLLLPQRSPLSYFTWLFSHNSSKLTPPPSIVCSFLFAFFFYSFFIHQSCFPFHFSLLPLLHNTVYTSTWLTSYTYLLLLLVPPPWSTLYLQSTSSPLHCIEYPTRLQPIAAPVSIRSHHSRPHHHAPVHPQQSHSTHHIQHTDHVADLHPFVYGLLCSFILFEYLLLFTWLPLFHHIISNLTCMQWSDLGLRSLLSVSSSALSALSSSLNF